ncbi:hypothetical protein [Kitasatospora sp. NPDC087315]|uniref:hypothetical protein n=1 Tax=Kitasatospora sp. NPDC087315 TaxID=3364069 RepID=UPI00382FF36A
MKQARTIAGRLNDLINAVNEARNLANSPHITYTELVERAYEATQPARHLSTDSVRHIREARNGRGLAPNPTVATLDALGAAFGLRNGARYFLSDAEMAAGMLDQVREAHGLSATRGNDGVAGLMHRAAELGPANRRVVSSLMDQLLEIERLHRSP